MKEIHYSIDGGAETVVSNSTAAFTVSAEGVHNVTYYAIDNCGNVENAKSLQVQIDKTNPTLTFGTSAPAPNGAGWNNSNVSVPFTAADSLSGVASTNPAGGLSLFQLKGPA